MMNKTMIVHCPVIIIPGKMYVSRILDVDGNYKQTNAKVVRVCNEQDYRNFVAEHAATVKEELKLGPYFYEIEILPD